MKTRTICVALGALLLAGCWQKSLHPFYTGKDLAFDEGLIGEWKERHENDAGAEEDRQVWTFTRAAEQRYELLVRGNEAAESGHKFDAHLFRLDGHYLLDLLSQERGGSTVPAHHLFQVLEIGPELKLAPLNRDWMNKWLRQHPASLAHLRVLDPEHRDDRDKDELVLAADTRALQAFLRAHWSDEGLFAGPIVFKSNAPAGKR